MSPRAGDRDVCQTTSGFERADWGQRTMESFDACCP